jgi:RNA polymerase primary sigma factor
MAGSPVDDGCQMDSDKAFSLRVWQAAALRAWSENGFRGIVQAVTGAGKTALGLAAIRDHLRRGASKAVILVPSIALMNQWHQSVRASLGVESGMCGGGHRSDLEDVSVLICVVNSAQHYLPREVAELSSRFSVLLIADECHRYGSRDFAKSLQAPYAKTLGLSATPQRKYDEAFESVLEPKLGKIVYTVGFEEALKADIIAKFSVAYVGLPLNKKERETYNALSLEIKKMGVQLRSQNRGLRDLLFFAREQAGAGNPTAIRYMARLGQRTMLLYRSEARAEFLVWLAREHLRPNASRAIVFQFDIAACDALSRHLNDHLIRSQSIHSQSSAGKTRVNYELRRFSSGLIDILVVAKMLDEGLDVPEASLAIICAQSTVDRQMTQRLGRILRKADGKVGSRAVVLYSENTREDPYVEMPDPSEETFFQQISDLGRISNFRWPSDGLSIIRWLTSDRIFE